MMITISLFSALSEMFFIAVPLWTSGSRRIMIHILQDSVTFYVEFIDMITLFLSDSFEEKDKFISYLYQIALAEFVQSVSMGDGILRCTFLVQR